MKALFFGAAHWVLQCLPGKWLDRARDWAEVGLLLARAERKVRRRAALVRRCCDLHQRGL